MARPAHMLRSMRPAISLLQAAVVATALASLFGTAASVGHADVLRTGGTGAATEFIRRIGAAFSSQDTDITIEVIPSLGSGGAIAAVIDGTLDFAVSGRPLSPREAATPLTAIVLARSPFGLATSYPQPGSIASSKVARFMASPASAWPDGTPLRIILRPRNDADSAVLANSYPGMAATIELLRQRPEILVATTDQANLRAAETTQGSLAGLTLTQFLTEHSTLHFLAIDGVEPTLENFERGSYPHGKDFSFVFASRRTPALDRFIAFLTSPEGERLLRETGNLPVRQ